MNEIQIKSQALNRARLKSDIFANVSNIRLIEEELKDVLVNFRENIACKSIVITHIKDITLDMVIARINKLFSLNITASIAASNAVCSVGGSCSSCNIKLSSNPISFKRKLIEFGLLTAYSIYLFFVENVLGVAVVASPLSLIAMVSIVAAIPLFVESYEDIKNNNFTLQTFMSGTLLLAILLGEAMAAFEIIYILRGGMLLEEYIATKSKNEIKNLIELDIKKVYTLVDDVEIEVDIEDICIGDIVVSRSGEKIPVDGVIVNGNAEIDESLINGRSDSVYKQKDEELFAGTFCETGRVYIKVNAIGNDTYISRVMSDVEKSLALKSPSQIEADKLAQKLLKLGSIMTLGTLVLSGSFINAFSVMIIMSCPCSTILAASTAISAGIANGAKQGILIKGGESLEKVSQSEVFCFDKTGTLTTGKPIVKDIVIVDDINKSDFIEYLAIAEYRNTHPIATAIVEYSKRFNIDIDQDSQTQVIPGFGVKTIYKNKTIIAGNQSLFTKQKISTKEFKKQTSSYLDEGKTIVYLAVDKKLLGFITLEHEIREGTKKMINDLRAKGVKHIALVTGDEEKVANSFALDFHFDTVFANQTPHGKADAIESLKKEYKNVVMVGDGVNDTLAMSKADVAISFAAGGSDAAIEVSNIAVTHSHPEDVVNLYDLSKKTLKVVNQNYWIGTSTNIIGAAFASIGLLSPAAAGAIHIGHTTSIMANSSKLAIDNNY